MGTPEQKAYWDEWGRVSQAMQDAGAMVLGAPLAPVTEAVSVRPTGHAVGPFGAGEDMLTGYLVIEAPDLAAATAWADRLPNVLAGSGGVEVRAAVPMAVPA